MKTITNERPLLVLDLDEALVHTVYAPLPGRQPDFVHGEFIVYKRPFLDEFLTRVWKHFDVAVWSAGGSGYVRPVVEIIMKEHPAPLFVWSFERCTRRFDQETHEVYHIKDLKKVRKLGFDSRRILIVDDTPRNSIRNFGSAVYISAFEGQSDDRELVYLADYLDTLASEPNFRVIEKRWWRSKCAVS